MRRFFLTATAVAISTAAMAADTVVVEPVAPALFVWTGGYIGLQAGHAWGKSAYDVDINTAYIPYNPDGWFGGVFAGYNHQFQNNVVAGVEGDLNLGGVKSGLTPARAPIPLPGQYGESQIKWQGSVRARLGYAFDRLLPYVTGGIAFARYDHSVTTFGYGAQFSDNYSGWTAGAGLEYAATDNLIARIEYRYSDYGDKNIPFTNGLFPHTTDLKTHDIRMGVAYKF